MSSTGNQQFEASCYRVERADKLRIIIIQATWNNHITNELYSGCVNALRKSGISDDNIILLKVPGCYELINGSRIALEGLNPDAVICLGCLIKGETPHFEYIADATVNGLSYIQAQTSTPVTFGVLTVLTEQQAIDRVGGKAGHKGYEAGQTALEMVGLRQQVMR